MAPPKTVTDPCESNAGNTCFKDARGRATVTMAIPGGVLLLGGAAMIAVGEVRRQRLSATVVAERDEFGFTVQGRF